MSKREISLIFYHVPQDQDDPQAPNVFHVPERKDKIRLKHILQYFPLKGTYSFRFKLSHHGFIVWLDLNDPEVEVPAFKDKIHVKANRISWNQSKQIFKTQPHSTHQSKSSPKKEPMNLFDHHEEPATHPQSSKLIGSGQMNLLGDHSPSLSSPGIKADFFEDSKPEPKPKKEEINLIGHVDQHQGDLI